ncbi:hypothetical protein [Pseudomonas sp. 34 E 7]|nr:hypothetical protein [Pseudomonas sp. 34 E 7]
MTPVGAVQPLEQLRRQQHRAGLQVAFGRQRQGKVRRLQGFEQVEAYVAVTQLVTGQCRRQQHQGIGLWVKLVQEADEGSVQGPQPATVDPALQQLHQVGGATERRQFLQQ